MKKVIFKISNVISSFLGIFLIITCLMAMPNSPAKAAGDSCLIAIPITPTPYFQVTDITINDSLIWFKFVASATSEWLYVTPSQNPFDTPITNLSDMKVYSGTCSSLSLIVDSVISTIPPNQHAKVTGLTIGNTYYIKITNSSLGTTYFGLSLSDSLGETCSTVYTGALTITPSALIIPTLNYQVSGSDSWFMFEADSTKTNIYLLPPTIPDDSMAYFPLLSVYDASLTLIATASSSVGNDTLPYILLTGLIIGNTYYFDLTTSYCSYCPVYGYFKVWVYDSYVPVPPANCTYSPCGPNLACPCFIGTDCFTTSLIDCGAGTTDIWDYGDYTITPNANNMSS